MSLKIVDHPDKGYIEIEGINYAYEFFKTFGINGPPVGSIVRIEGRQDGTIGVTKLREGPSTEIKVQ